MIPALLLKIVTNKFALLGLAGAFLGLALGVQTLRLSHAKADLQGARSDRDAFHAQFTASESARKTEHASAASAFTALDQTCNAHIDDARRSATVICKIVGAPYRVDPKSNCPVRAVVGAAVLRNALTPH